MDEREAAWTAVHDAIARLPSWTVGPTSYHGEAASRHVPAVDLSPRGRQAKRAAIEATGPTEVVALLELAELERVLRRYPGDVEGRRES